jgi:hypothetical protein
MMWLSNPYEQFSIYPQDDYDDLGRVLGERRGAPQGCQEEQAVQRAA